MLNVGTGKEYTIAELAGTIKAELDYQGDVIYDGSLPDGVLRKLQDVSKINDLGWQYSVELGEGIRLAYHDYLTRIKEKELIIN